MGWLISVALGSVSLLAIEVRAYPVPVDFDGSLLRWQITAENPRVSYEIVASVSDLNYYGRLVEDSANQWSDVDGSVLRLEKAVEDEVAQITVKLTNTLDGSAYSAGFAVFDSKDNNGPTHCTIEVLVDRAYSNYSLGKSILHELGHCVGLGHSVVPTSIMSYSLGANDFALDTDDEAAIARLYPPEGHAALPPGCAIGLGRGQRQPWLLGLLLLPLLASLGAGWQARARQLGPQQVKDDFWR